MHGKLRPGHYRQDPKRWTPFVRILYDQPVSRLACPGSCRVATDCERVFGPVSFFVASLTQSCSAHFSAGGELIGSACTPGLSQAIPERSLAIAGTDWPPRIQAAGDAFNETSPGRLGSISIFRLRLSRGGSPLTCFRYRLVRGVCTYSLYRETLANSISCTCLERG